MHETPCGFRICDVEWCTYDQVDDRLVRSSDPPQGNNPGQQLYHARPEQLGQSLAVIKLSHARCFVDQWSTGFSRGYKGPKMGVETIHFTKFWQKIGVEIRHFPIFSQILGSKLYKFSRGLQKGGRNGGAYVVTFIEWVPSPGFSSEVGCATLPRLPQFEHSPK